MRTSRSTGCWTRRHTDGRTNSRPSWRGCRLARRPQHRLLAARPEAGRTLTRAANLRRARSSSRSRARRLLRANNPGEGRTRTRAPNPLPVRSRQAAAAPAQRGDVPSSCSSSRHEPFDPDLPGLWPGLGNPAPLHRPAQPPTPPGAPGDGWNAVDALAADAALKLRAPCVTKVPVEYQPDWRAAVLKCLSEYEATTEAGDDVGRNRALQWFLLLPNLLLRKSVARGGRRGNGQMRARFAAFTAGEHGKVLAWMLADASAARTRGSRKPRHQSDEQMYEQAMRLLAGGEISKAKSMLESHGLADLFEPVFEAQMRAKHPPASRPMASDPAAYGPAGTEKVVLPDMLGSLHTLPRLRAAGPTGMRNEHLIVLCSPGDPNNPAMRSAWQLFATHWVQADLPAWFYKTVTAYNL